MVALTEELTILIDTMFKDKGVKRAKSFLEEFRAETERLRAPQMFSKIPENIKKAVTYGGQFFNNDFGKVLKTGLNVPGLKEIKIDMQNAGRTAAKLNSALPLMKNQFIEVEKATKAKTMLELDNSFKSVMSSGKRVDSTLNDMTSAGKKHALLMNNLGIDYITNSGRIVRGMKNMKENANNMKKRFAMEYLGIMFGGMMLQKSFMRIATIAQESFMRITEGQGQAAQSFHALNAGITLVKFSIGNAIATALSPFIPKIIEVVEWITDWIGNNKELVSGIVLGGLAIGTFALLLGQAVLFGQALINALGKKGLLGHLLAFSTAHPIIAGVVAVLVIGLAALLRWGEMRSDLVSMWKDGIVPAIKPALENILSIIYGTNDVDDAWKLAGSTMFWALSILSEILTVIVNIASGIVTVGKVMTLSFSGMGSLASIELQKYLDSLKKQEGSQKKIWSNILAGPMGEYNKMNNGNNEVLPIQQLSEAPGFINTGGIMDLFKQNVEGTNGKLLELTTGFKEQEEFLGMTMIPQYEGLDTALSDVTTEIMTMTTKEGLLSDKNFILLEDSNNIVDQNDNEILSWQLKRDEFESMIETTDRLITKMDELDKKRAAINLAKADEYGS